MGLGYKGGAESYHSISDNVRDTAKKYPYKNGYFGDAGTSKRVRIIYSDNPAQTGKEFYDSITYGGVEKSFGNGKGFITKMTDGTIITFRPTTKSDNNPGVDINITYSSDSGGLKQQKIHFEKESLC